MIASIFRCEENDIPIGDAVLHLKFCPIQDDRQTGHGKVKKAPFGDCATWALYRLSSGAMNLKDGLTAVQNDTHRLLLK